MQERFQISGADSIACSSNISPMKPNRQVFVWVGVWSCYTPPLIHFNSVSGLVSGLSGRSVLCRAAGTVRIQLAMTFLACYLSAFRIMLARPLPVRRTMLEWSSFRLIRACCCSFVMLGVGKGVGGCAWMVLTDLLTVTRAGVPTKVRTFFNKDTSASLRVLDDKLITQSTLWYKCRAISRPHHQKKTSSKQSKRSDLNPTSWYKR